MKLPGWVLLVGVGGLLVWLYGRQRAAVQAVKDVDVPQLNYWVG